MYISLSRNHDWSMNQKLSSEVRIRIWSWIKYTHCWSRQFISVHLNNQHNMLMQYNNKSMSVLQSRKNIIFFLLQCDMLFKQSNCMQPNPIVRIVWILHCNIYLGLWLAKVSICGDERIKSYNGHMNMNNI